MRAGGIVAAFGAALIALGVSAAPAGAATPDELDGFEYVALGDSYSAGFGLTPFSATSPFTATPSTEANGCYQADANYPHLLAGDLGLAIDDQTCSGAISANLGYPGSTTLPVPPTDPVLPTLPAGSEVETTMNGQIDPQLQTASLGPTTDIVTVAIGGNDLGFSDIAEGCIRLDDSSGSFATGLQFLGGVEVENCQSYFDDAGTYPNADLQDRLDTYVVPRIAAVLDEIAAAAPNAQVFVVGYPEIATADPALAASCFSSPIPPATNTVPFSGTDIEFIHGVEGLLNAALESQAAAHGFHFVSTEASTTGHALCDPEPWIQGLTVQLPSGSPATCPAGYLPLGRDGTTYVCVELGALHPNADGVANLRAVVEPAIQAAFGVSVSNASPAAGDSITVTGTGFYPNESVAIELRSTPVLLATATADASGSFTATVTVPSGTAAGAHEIVATGAASGHAFADPITVAGPALAATGIDPLPPLLLGLCLVTTGFLLVVVRSRRRDTAR